jgi:plastocyanin
MTTRRTLLHAMIAAATLVLVVGAVVFAAGNNKKNSTIGPDGVVEMQLGAVSFEPEEITIPAGTVVRFVNSMDIEHDVVQTTPQEVERKKAHDDDGHGHKDDDGNGREGEKHSHADDEHGHGPEDVSLGFHSPHLEHHGDSWEARFTEPGEYPILCTVNDHYKAGMVGRIVVSDV